MRMLYSYGSEDVDDTDWGCVYRSFQNAQVHTAGGPPTPIWALVEHVHRGWAAWVEPADFCDFAGCGLAITLLAGASATWLQHTAADQYQFYIPSIAALEAYIRRAGRQCAFVVDDGESGYAIVPWKGEPHWVDPHTARPRRVPLASQLRRSPGWMVLQLIPDRA